MRIRKQDDVIGHVEYPVESHALHSIAGMKRPMRALAVANGRVPSLFNRGA